MPLSERGPDQILARDLLAPDFDEEMPNDDKLLLTRAHVLVMQQLVQHIGKTMDTLLVSDLLNLDITRHQDGTCFITNTDVQGQTIGHELKPEMAAAFDTINARLEKRWPKKEDIRLHIVDLP